MTDWQTIDSAPTDGTVVLTKREYNGSTMGPYRSVFAPMAADAPMRFPADGGRYAPLRPDNEYADKPGWCTEDRRYHAPGPTHWRPLPEATQG